MLPNSHLRKWYFIQYNWCDQEYFLVKLWWSTDICPEQISIFTDAILWNKWKYDKIITLASFRCLTVISSPSFPAWMQYHFFNFLSWWVFNLRGFHLSFPLWQLLYIDKSPNEGIMLTIKYNQLHNSGLGKWQLNECIGPISPMWDNLYPLISWTHDDSLDLQTLMSTQIQYSLFSQISEFLSVFNSHSAKNIPISHSFGEELGKSMLQSPSSSVDGYLFCQLYLELEFDLVQELSKKSALYWISHTQPSALLCLLFFFFFLIVDDNQYSFGPPLPFVPKDAVFY